MIKISAIVCTFKRRDYLQRTLRSLCRQTLSRDDYEIIVVDNAVEVETESLVSEFQDGRINLRYLAEPEVGLNRARNAGIHAARGQFIAYIDDDARADEAWLEKLLVAFEETSPRPAVVGGRVWLDWQGEKPKWVPARHLALYTYVDHGDQPHLLEDDEYLVGANLAFNLETLRSFGGFDPNLDRQGSVLLSGGDTAAIKHFQQKGKSVLYEPAAVVWHSVLPSRNRPGWLLTRLFWEGATQPLLDRARKDLTRRLLVHGAYADLRQCAGWCIRALTASIRGRKTSAWEALLGASHRAGRVRTQVLMIASIHD